MTGFLDPDDIDFGPPAPGEYEPLVTTLPAARRVVEPDRSRAVDGATFLEGGDETVPAVWGKDGEVLWSEGEPLMIVGPDGVGKTSLAQQLTLGRLGLRSDLLGSPIANRERRVLYIAADRPKQAARSLRRMVDDDDLETLRRQLVVWKGPLPFDLAGKGDDRAALADLATELRATDVVIDSLKDVALDLSTDETGSRVSVAIQEVIARGIEVCVLHHQRKAQQGAGKPNKLADVYGSRWLIAGMGSVVVLWGDAGDSLVEFRHLKQPAEEVGPFNLLHDHVHGRTTVYDSTDLEQLLASAPYGLIVADAARLLFASDPPAAKEIEKARRKLESLVGRKRAERRDDPDGLARYFTFESGREHRE